MPTIAVRLSREEIKAALRALPAQMSGRDSGESVLVRDLHNVAGREALETIHEAYVVKSLGGTDAAGITWPPRKRADSKRRPPQRTVWARHVASARRVQTSPRPIGIRTGRLITSLEERTATPDQVFELEAGAVTVGTRVPYAGHFAALRPIFPVEWPAEWMQRLASRVARRLGELLVEALSRR